MSELPSEKELRRLVERATRSGARPEEVAAARAAAGLLFASCEDRIHWLCLRLVGRPELAAELTQEALLTAWRRLPDFRGESSFYAWLYAIARHGCLRARARKGEALAEDALLEPEHPGRSALAQLRRAERDALLDDVARAVLDPTEQEAVVLRYSLGMGYAEITEVLGLRNPSGARAVLQASKQKLRPELERRLARLGHGHSLVLGSIGPDA